MKSGLSSVILFISLFGTLLAAPAKTDAQTQSEDLDSKLNALQQQIAELQKSIASSQNRVQISQLLPDQAPAQGQYFDREARAPMWQPMKRNFLAPRMVSWQPMKRANQDNTREQVILAIEQQLSEVLHAGETLGVTAEDVLAHLRQRNAQGGNGIFFQK